MMGFPTSATPGVSQDSPRQRLDSSFRRSEHEFVVSAAIFLDGSRYLTVQKGAYRSETSLVLSMDS